MAPIYDFQNEFHNQSSKKPSLVSFCPPIPNSKTPVISLQNPAHLRVRKTLKCRCPKSLFDQGVRNLLQRFSGYPPLPDNLYNLSPLSKTYSLLKSIRISSSCFPLSPSRNSAEPTDQGDERFNVN